ncbi:ATP-binding protein [Streptomyces sp. NBC_01565]|uniref:ATP-binding protein n=1 Tax=unclassified Streptomyces TaxID=2593676 RepID=UPI002259F05C|nr:ATP-binding protein [Streptomyces sp. NBC_01565]MCX4545446.1 ATP-binding protein [Streptomyces sp. NBC_01565]
MAQLLGSALGTARPPLSDEAVADAFLVTSELVTNALRHGGGLTEFAAEIDRDVLTITVADASSEVPHTSETHSAMSEGGFGWPLILLLAQEVSVAPSPGGGKSIQVILPLR